MIYIKHSWIFVIIITLTCTSVGAQSEIANFNNDLSLQYGFSGKCLVEFSTNEHPIVKCGINAGIASNFIAPEIHPSLNLELLIYNGGIGSTSSKHNKNKRPALVMDFIPAFTFTVGEGNQLRNINQLTLEKRNIPLYYFANFTFPGLINPFRSSFSLGIDLIFSTDKGRAVQRIGFINLHWKRAQVSYYNDGGSPISLIKLGDTRDRYYTGGAVISYHERSNKDINLLELAFHKFTGYSKNAFEISNKLDLAYVGYNDDRQKYFNKSVWMLNLANPFRGIGVNIKGYNHVSIDAQHYIHIGTEDAFHISPYPSFFSINAGYYYSYTELGLR